MIKKVIIPLMVIVIAVVWFYQYLGGFDKVTFNETTISLYFQGNEYQGLYNNPETEKLFLSAREAAVNASNAELAIMSYPSTKDSLHQIIGLVSKEPIEATDMIYKEELTGRYLETIITAHNLVMPKPNEVIEKAKGYASKNDLTVDGRRSIDIYQGNRSLRILIPLVD